MGKSVWKDLFREIKRTFGRFIAIFAIVAIGVAFFAGVTASSNDMKNSTDHYYDDYNMSDLRLLSSIGFNEDDINVIREVQGVKGICPAYSQDAVIRKDSIETAVHIMSVPVNTDRDNKDYINQLRIKEGRLPEKSGECVVRYEDTKDNFSIGDTINELNCIDPLPPIEIEKPTLSMNFLVNNGPFAGQSGKFLTTRHIKERLERELETNVGLEVEELEGSDGFKVSGRGELHLSILLENMRREGYELCVSKPEVLFKEIDGQKCEPYELVIVNTPNDYSSTIINSLQERKGLLQKLEQEENYTHLEFEVPTRGLIGYRSNFITETKGEGIMVRSFSSYKPYAGNIQNRKNGVLVSMETGKSLGYSLFNLQDRGQLIIGPATDVYIGMIVGINNRDNDLNVNPCKNKEMSNTRSKSSDEAIALVPPKTFSLEEALEFINDDEYVEITPAVIRLRKKILDPKDRFRTNR